MGRCSAPSLTSSSPSSRACPASGTGPRSASRFTSSACRRRRPRRCERDPRGKGAHRLLHGVREPHGGGALHHLPRRAARPLGDLRRRAAGRSRVDGADRRLPRRLPRARRRALAPRRRRARAPADRRALAPSGAKRRPGGRARDQPEHDRRGHGLLRRRPPAGPDTGHAPKRAASPLGATSSTRTRSRLTVPWPAGARCRSTPPPLNPLEPPPPYPALPLVSRSRAAFSSICEMASSPQGLQGRMPLLSREPSGLSAHHFHPQRLVALLVLVLAAALPTLIRMTETAFEAPARIEPAEPDEARQHVGTVVMKFGGTSVADPEKIRRCAAARRGARAGTASSASSRRWAARPTSSSISRTRVAPAEPARARHAHLGRRADLVRARGDGDLRPRARGDLAHRLAGRHRHRHRPRQGEDRRDARTAHPRGARRRADRARRRLPGRLEPRST